MLKSVAEGTKQLMLLSKLSALRPLAYSNGSRHDRVPQFNLCIDFGTELLLTWSKRLYLPWGQNALEATLPGTMDRAM